MQEAQAVALPPQAYSVANDLYLRDSKICLFENALTSHALCSLHRRKTIRKDAEMQKIRLARWAVHG
jgi:hypothetical protein